MTDSLVDLRLSDLLESVAEDSTSVASGAVAAMTAASAAGLLAMSARRGEGWEGALGAAGQGEILRRRATELIDVSATAFEGAVAELETARAASGEGDERRDWRLGQALRRAADTPLEVATIAADVALLAVEVATSCDEAVRADAVSACLLAESATAIAAHLVGVNLAAGGDEAPMTHARELSAAAAAARTKVLA